MTTNSLSRETFSVWKEANSGEVSKSFTNEQRRQKFVECERFRMSLDDQNELDKTILAEIQTIQNNDLKIISLKNKYSIYTILDEVVRITAVWMALVTGTLVLLLPMLVLSPLESFYYSTQGLKPKIPISLRVKRFISDTVLLVGGLSLDITFEVSEEETFRESSIVCFSHGSTIDAFILSSAISVKNYTLAKDDLFLIPFFNLLLHTFSGIPIVRSNIEKAKQSLRYVQECLKEGECISIAPEGTRSKTGLLLDFKKGPFHTWEHLQIPIIPLVIVGAFELFPPGHQMCRAGKVYVHYLKPVQCSEVSSRDDMSRVVRERMLDYLAVAPADASRPLNSSEQTKSVLATFALLAFDYQLFQFVQKVIVLELGISWYSILKFFLLFTVLSSPGIYLYTVYLLPFLSARASSQASAKIRGQKKAE